MWSPVAIEILEVRLLFASAPHASGDRAGSDRAGGADLSLTLGQYHTYASATTELRSLASEFPNLTRLISIGKTVQKREIWAIEITDHPGVNEDEPEVFYQGSMHGDEPVGMEMCFYFIDELLSGYGADSRITNDVNNMDIWIVPNLNWDGYMHDGGGSANAQRTNANGVDLNRNFPEWTIGADDSSAGGDDTVHRGAFGNVFDGPAPKTSGLQPETVAMINFRRQHRFVTSANFHSGSLVVNYPWDGNGNGVADYAATPDDALFRQLALTYARTNGPMMSGRAGGFAQGITNGDNWYEVSGGMQDWSYLYTGDMETTIELSTTKYPARSALPARWNENRASMFNYMEAANWGVRGTVTDALTGAPLSAKVTLVSPTPNPPPDPNHPPGHAVFTDPAIGDYHRMLLSGTYALKFEAAGHVSQTIRDVVTIAGLTPDPTATLRLDVRLAPIAKTARTVRVEDKRERTNAPPATAPPPTSRPVQRTEPISAEVLPV